MRNKNLDKTIEEEEVRIRHELMSLKHKTHKLLLSCTHYSIVPSIAVLLVAVTVIYIKNNTWNSAYEHLKYTASSITQIFAAVIVDRYFFKRYKK